MDEPDAQELFARLVQALSDVLPADRPLAPVNGDGPFLYHFRMDTHPVQLLCHLAIQPVHVTVACPLGPLPEGDPETALRQLLRVNHLIATSGTTTAYEPTDGLLYLLHSRPLATTGPAMLLQTMLSLVTVARGWLESGFLEGAGHALLPSAPTDMASAGLRA